MATILILGATSDMARASALKFGAHGWNIQLAGRQKEAIEKVACDISLRIGVQVESFVFDALESNSYKTLWESLPVIPDVILCAIGLLGDHKAASHDPSLMKTIVHTNFNGLLPILSLAADEFEKRGSGAIIGISSVAGDRGRGSNYIYGSAKAGFSAFLSGLRNRLATKGVHVLTIKPGFVYTEMTQYLNLPAALTATPEEVAQKIYVAFLKKRNIVYINYKWKYIMLIIKILPEFIFKKLKF